MQLNECHPCRNIIGIVLSIMIMRGGAIAVRFDLIITYELFIGI